MKPLNGPTLGVRDGVDSDEEELVGSIFNPDTPGDLKVILTRQDDVTGAFLFHGTLNLERATEEFVSSLFGGGNYRFRLEEKDEKGRWVYCEQRTKRIPGPYRPPTGALPTLGITHATLEGRASDTAPPALPLDLTKMMENAAVMRAMDMMTQRPQGGEVLTSLVAGLMGIAQTALPLLIGRKDPLAEKLTRELEALRSEIANQGRREPPSALLGVAPGDVMRAFKEFGTMRSALMGDAGEDGPDPDRKMYGTLEKVLEMILARSSGATTTATPIASRVEIHTRGDGEMGSAGTWQALLSKHRATLETAIRRQMDPVRLAEILVDWASDDEFDSVAELLSLPAPVESVLEILPALRVHEKYMTLLLEGLRRELETNEEQPDAPTE